MRPACWLRRSAAARWPGQRERPGHAGLYAGLTATGLALLAALGPPAQLRAEPRAGETRAELDTEHMFGFVTGTDVGEGGEKEIESESTGRLGKRSGAYAARSHVLGMEYTPVDNLRFELGASESYHDISGVPELDDLRRGAFAGLSLDMRYRLLDRARAGLGLTLLAEPHWARVDETSGQPVTRHGAALAILMDRELVPGRLVAAFNLLYEPEAVRSEVTGERWREATFGLGAAIMQQVGPGLFVGLEARYLRQHESLGFDAFAGHAFFLGPNVFFTPSEHWRITATWSMQVAGRAAEDPAALDLTNFERHQVRLSIGYRF